MTEQEIEQAREDLEQLGIEQLRCGVMIQLLKIEALTKERDALALEVNQWRVDFHELSLERDALAADAARYRWLRRSATKLSFDNALTSSLVRDQSELDGAIKEAGAQ
jgi:hypothetical protein